MNDKIKKLSSAYGINHKNLIVLFSIIDEKEYTQHEIEKKTFLRQPEVSHSLKWILLTYPDHFKKSVRPLSNGKGRPENTFQLISKKEEFITKFISDFTKNRENEINSVKDLVYEIGGL